MKNRINKSKAGKPGFVIKRVSVSKRVKIGLRRYARDKGISLRDAATLVLKAELGSKCALSSKPRRRRAHGAN